MLLVNHTGEMGGAEFVLAEWVQRSTISPKLALLSNGPLAQRLERSVQVSIIEGGNGLLTLGQKTSGLARLWALRRMPVIVRALSEEAKHVDVVYANSKKGLVFAALAARKARRPLIWHQHDEMRIPKTLRLRERASESLLIYLLNRYVARVISVSRASAGTFISAGGRADLPVVVHNGLDPVRYSRPVDRIALRQATGLPIEAPLIGCFGRLTEWKGQRVLIDALAGLPQAHLVLVGGALFGESDYEASLREQVDRLGLGGRVHFLGHRDDVPALMQAVDVVAHTSIEFEPFGRVIVEAMLSGCPVVASATGGVPELVEDGVSGLLVPPRDAPALASALQRVLNDNLFSARLTKAGRERALRDFTLERVVRQVEQVIREVVVADKTLL